MYKSQTGKRKAIVVLYSPKTISDFIWYYCTYGKDYDWTAICIPYGFSHSEIAFDLCKKSNIFDEVIFDKDDTSYWSIPKKAILLFEMFLYFISGKRKKFCEKFIKKRIKLNQYSLVVVPSDYMTLSGFFIATSDQRRTIILEDGAADYLERTKKIGISELRRIWGIAGAFLAKMRYANTGMKYWFEDTKYCEKFASKPELMKYKNYLSITKLNNFTMTDENLYNEIIRRIFSLNDEITDVALMVLTTPLNDFSDEENEVNDKIINYIVEKFPNSNILLKKHPRDTSKYSFPKEMRVLEVEKEIPAEIFLNGFGIKNIIFTFPSTTLLFMDQTVDDFDILYFNELEEKSKNAMNRYDYKSTFDRVIDSFQIDEKNIVRL